MDARGVGSYRLPVASFWKYWRRWVFIAVFALAGCGGQGAKGIVRIVLLSSFEGRYRDVGYEAYYAARLATSEWNNKQIELLAIDDGGTVESAVERAKALRLDPTVLGVVALGYAATDAETQKAFGELPLIIAGSWGAQPESEWVFVLAKPNLNASLTTPPRVSLSEAAGLEAPLVGHEIFALESLRQLREDLSGITIVSSTTLPNESFRERYINSDSFTPEPGLIAASTHQAVNLLLEAVMSEQSHNGIQQFLANQSEAGYWIDAPLHFFAYDESGDLFTIDRPIE